MNIHNFVKNQLLTNGFVIMDSKILYLLDPIEFTSLDDLTVSLKAQRESLEHLLSRFNRVQKVKVTLDGMGVDVYTRSLLDLARRIEHLTGYVAVVAEERKMETGRSTFRATM